MASTALLEPFSIQMKKTFLLSSIITSILVISSAYLPSVQIANAKQKNVSILKAKCVSSGLGSARLRKENVSIGRAVYTSKFYLGPGSRSAAITCKIRPDKSPQPVFKTLNLGFGMRDKDMTSPDVNVKIYLDGQEAETISIAPTKPSLAKIDVSNVSNVAVEAICTNPNRYCDRVYFFTADMER
ncbi:MAG: hypothetical protein AAF378_03795 [Cyanobacteria bacterium P01_A01_bin.84]